MEELLEQSFLCVGGEYINTAVVKTISIVNKDNEDSHLVVRFTDGTIEVFYYDGF